MHGPPNLHGEYRRHSSRGGRFLSVSFNRGGIITSAVVLNQSSHRTPMLSAFRCRDALCKWWRRNGGPFVPLSGRRANLQARPCSTKKRNSRRSATRRALCVSLSLSLYVWREKKRRTMAEDRKRERREKHRWKWEEEEGNNRRTKDAVAAREERV